MPLAPLDPDRPASGLPATDSLLRQFLTNWVASIEAHGFPDGRTLRRDDLAAVDLGHPAFGGNITTLTAPLFPEALDRVLATLDSFYGFATGAGNGMVFIFSPWPTPDLRPHGWTLLGHEPLMLRPVGGAAPPVPPELRITAVRDEADLDEFARTIVRGFDSTGHAAAGPMPVFGPGVLDDPRHQLWIGRVNDVPVAAASSFTNAEITNVTFAATVPEARRHGYGAALTWHATVADPVLPALCGSRDSRERRCQGRTCACMSMIPGVTMWPLTSRTFDAPPARGPARPPQPSRPRSPHRPHRRSRAAGRSPARLGG